MTLQVSIDTSLWTVEWCMPYNQFMSLNYIAMTDLYLSFSFSFKHSKPSKGRRNVFVNMKPVHERIEFLLSFILVYI